MVMPVIPTTVKNKNLVEDRREQIILAALKLFSKKGFHVTTLRDLAEAAGISHANIYDYVRTKEDIFYLLHEYIHHAGTQRMMSSIENIHDPLEKLRRTIRVSFEVNSLWGDAVLVIYQESHILSPPLLKLLLERERALMQIYENIIEECVQGGIIRKVNVRIVAHYIKSMIDTWVLKRWDLQGYVTETEMEDSLLELIFNGITPQKGTRPKQVPQKHSIEGKSALVVDCGTALGQAISAFLVSKGVRVGVYHKEERKEDRSDNPPKSGPGSILAYSSEEQGPLTMRLMQQMERELGRIDIIIQDIGIGYDGSREGKKDKVSFGERLESNLGLAQDLITYIQVDAAKRRSSRILYLAPWSWDKLADPLRYETVRAGTIALTKTAAEQIATYGLRVNCIVPGFIKMPRPTTIERGKGSDLASQIPLGRLGEMSDVLDAVMFLISDASNYVTGQVLEVFGGSR
jgi:3-oxoacyl-[acyl-carrier protein] reductase